MDFIGLLNLLVIAGWGAVFGFLLGGVGMNKWLKRRIAWQMGTAKKGFAFLVRAGRKAKMMDWDHREPYFEYGSKTYIIDPRDVFDIQNIPCILLSEKIGRTIPPENLPEDKDGLYSPEANFSYKTRLHDLFEARSKKPNLILGMKPEQFFVFLMIAVVIAIIVGALAFQQAGTATTVCENTGSQCVSALNRTIAVVR